MLGERARRGAKDGQGDQRHDHRGEHDVGDQQSEIDGAHDPLAAELREPGIEVVNQIGDQERQRRREGADHASAMQVFLALTDEHETSPQKNRRHAVEGGVDMGKIGNLQHRGTVILHGCDVRLIARCPSCRRPLP